MEANADFIANVVGQKYNRSLDKLEAESIASFVSKTTSDLLKLEKELEKSSPSKAKLVPGDECT
jgi:hypothetical protein